MLGYKKIIKLDIKKSKKKREEWSKKRYTKERERMEGIEKWGLLISPHLRNTPETDDIILNLQKEELGKSYKWVITFFSNVSHTREKSQTIAHILIQKIVSYVLEHFS